MKLTSGRLSNFSIIKKSIQARFEWDQVSFLDLIQDWQLVDCFTAKL